MSIRSAFSTQFVANPSRPTTTVPSLPAPATKPATPVAQLKPAVFDVVAKTLPRPVTVDFSYAGPTLAPPIPRGSAVVADRSPAIDRTMKTMDLIAGAQAAGLNPKELRQLESILNSRPFGVFERDGKLVEDLTKTGNGDRALRTFIDLESARSQNKGRITEDVVRSLCMGVGESRSSISQSHEGILSRAQALAAANALNHMPQHDYDQIMGTLSHVGSNAPQVERSLLLKAVAARSDELTQSKQASSSDPFRILFELDKKPSATQEILNFANTIRGCPKWQLIFRSTVTDLDGDKTGEALKQRWADSCFPTTLQILHAEADPIYAWRLHDSGAISDVSTNNEIAAEQKRVLEQAGGIAVIRKRNDGVGLTMEAMDSQIEALTGVLGRDYTRHNISNTTAARESALAYMEHLVEYGRDVPIVVGLGGRANHVLIVTDVKGTGKSSEFLVTDPLTGKTDWIKQSDIVSGGTNFFAATGRLTSYFI